MPRSACVVPRSDLRRFHLPSQGQACIYKRNVVDRCAACAQELVSHVLLLLGVCFRLAKLLVDQNNRQVFSHAFHLFSIFFSVCWVSFVELRPARARALVRASGRPFRVRKCFLDDIVAACSWARHTIQGLGRNDL